MVFESIVADVLNKILGDYVENLDSKQLSIGIWGGDVVLNDLVLKQTALDDLDLPVQNVYGRLGKLVLKIPWKNLYGAPVEAEIDRLYLLLCPNQQIKYDPAKEEKYELESKQNELKRIEDAKKKAEQQGQAKVDDTFVEKLTTQIIKNVQIKITDIHIRYEDSVTNPGKPFALGITLSNLSVHTTNDQWKAAIVSDALSKIYKVLNLDALAMYWNSYGKLYSKLPVEDIIKSFEEGIATRDSKPENYTYILGPINSSARLRLNPKPDADEEPFSLSKVLLNLEMEKLAIGLNKSQFHDIMLLANSMERMSCGAPYRKYRPFVNSYKGHYKEWWKFAYTCILETEVRRNRRNWDWEHISRHRAVCKEYADAYLYKLKNKKVPKHTQEQLDRCEKHLNLTTLVIIRQKIELEVIRLSRATEEKKAATSWFSGWWGKSAKDDDKDLTEGVDYLKQFENAMTAAEKSKLYKAIDYQENSAPAEFPETFVATNCVFILRCLEIEITDNLQNMRVIHLALEGVNCRLQQRPAASAIQVAVKINQLTMSGMEQNDVIPQLISSEDFGETGVLLDVLFETNPIDNKNCGQRLHLMSLPLKVIYDAQTILQIQEFFQMPSSLDGSQLQAVAGSTLADLKEMSATGMQYAVEKHVVLDLDVNLAAPYIIIPYGGIYSSTKAALVINLGQVVMKSVQRDLSNMNVRKMYSQGTAESDIIKEVMSHSYDKFIIELSALQVLIANENEDWKSCIIKNKISPMHLLQPMNLILGINKCLVTDDPRLPKIQIIGELPSVALNMSDDRLKSLLKLASSIPQPESKEVELDILSRVSSKSSIYSYVISDVPPKKKNKPKEKEVDLTNFVQATDLEVKFEMKELVVIVSKKIRHTEELAKKIEFRCMCLELDMIQQSYNMDVVVRLGGIGLTQFRPNCDVQILSTPMTKGEKDYLLTVKYTQTKKTSPEFHVKYGSCEQSLDLTFTSLHLQLHQEGLNELLILVNEFQKKLTLKNEPQVNEMVSLAVKSSKRLPTIAESHAMIVKNASQRKKVRRIVETILFKLTADIQELDVLVATDREPLANFAVKGIRTDVILKESYTQVTAALMDIVIVDLNPSSIHSKILCRTGTDNAIDAQIVLYNLDTTGDTDKSQMSVTVTMSCLKITFLNLFVSGLLNFLNHFQAAQQAIIDASAAAAENAKKNMANAYQNATRVDLNIKLKAPVIIVPTNSTSYDGVMLDLGYIELTNHFVNLEAVNELGHHAVIDELKLYLKNCKLCRILLDKHLEKQVDCVLMKPLSCFLKIKRNLSASWYNNIPDLDIAGEMKSIELVISEADYKKVMQVLNENLNEKVEAIDVVVLQKEYETKTNAYSSSNINVLRKASSQNIVKSLELPSDTPHVVLRFTFTMESFIISLYKGGSETFDEDKDYSIANHLPSNGLAQFTILVLSVKGRIASDNSITTSILLIDCLLDDIRTGREGKLTRLMERKQDTVSDVVLKGSSTDSITRSMIDVTYQQNDEDMFVDVRVYSFNLILSIDYLMKIASFFSVEKSDTTSTASAKTEKITKSKTSNKSTSKIEIKQERLNESSMTINLKVEKPDIILVERMDSIDTRALILNNEVLLNVRIVGPNQAIRGQINDIELYICCYNPLKRKETECPVMHPFNIVIVGTTPLNQGLHLDITFSPIRISVSPAIIELLSTIQKTMYATDVVTEDETTVVQYYTDLWDSQAFSDSEFWFLKTEQGEEAIDIIENPSVTSLIRALNEVCNVAAPQIIISVEAGVGNRTLPMLLMETSFEAAAHNWSSKLFVEASLTLQMNYYNNRLAIWEPLIEQVEVIENNQVTHTPWTLKFEMKNSDPEDVSSPQSEVEHLEETFTPPIMCINISSSVNLELVVTKTLLLVLSNLGAAFENAVKVGIPAKEIDTAPYRVVNDTGLQVTIMLKNSPFKLYKHNNEDIYKEVVLESGAEVQLELDHLKVGNININSRIVLNKSMSTYNQSFEMMERYITVMVNDMNCAVKLPVIRADQRYFPLNYRGENNDSWGLVSDLKVEGAENIITLRSILQVHNHFSQPVNMYYMTNRGNELEIVKQIPPHSTCNLPMHSVYTLTNELFFSVEGYCVSAAPYIWKDLQLNLSMTKTLPCPADKSSKQAFVIQVVGETEQIFFENTTKHTMASSCYHVHLRPSTIFLNCLPIPMVCIVQGDVQEITVQPGEQLHTPTINPGSSSIVIRLVNYLEKDWSCNHQIPLTPPEFSVWTFESHDSVAKMVLDLGMHCENKDGTIMLSLYCPFWMLNKTGLMLSYRKSSKTEKHFSGSPAKNSDENVNVLYHPEDYKQPILFSFNAKNFFGKKKAAIKIDTGDWSDKFSLDVAGSSGSVICKANDRLYQIGVHNQLTYNSLTKQVTFTPFFVLINNAPFVIECQELERPADPWIVVEPNSCTPLWPKTDRDDKLLKVRVGGTSDLSAPFLITEVHTVLLKLHNKYGGINADIQVTEGGVYVTFTQYNTGLAPALVINHTSEELKFWEKESVNVKRIAPKRKILLGWDNPTGPRLLVWENDKKKEIDDDLRKDGLGEVVFEGDRKVYWVSFLDGIQRVLLFTEDMSIARDCQSAGDLEIIEREISVSIYGMGLSLINNQIGQEIMYIGIASSGIIWEVCKMASKRYKQLSVHLCSLIEIAYQHYLHEDMPAGPVIIDAKTEIDFNTGLMLRPHKRRLRRAFQTGLWLQMKTSPNQMQLHAKINRIQIDNQMYDCIFPVILAPVPLPKSVAADTALRPFVELSIVQRIMKYSTVQQYKYFKVLIQEFHIKVDLGFVNSLMAVFEPKLPTTHEVKEMFMKDMALVNEALMSHVSTQSIQEQKNFYDLLHFSPLKIHVSFSLAAAQSSSGNGSQSVTPAFISVLLQGLGVTLTDMNDVVFRLAYFEREYSFLTQKQLTSEATSHYVGQAVKQLYVLVLGLDVIGNPYGLVLGISKGVEDLFYEPFQGAIQGPGEFAEGLVLGVRSLFGHTVGGAAGAVSKITGAMGKGIAALTFDKDYQRKRRDQFNKKPANIQEGIARGGKGLVMGVVDGVTGVFTKPISGAKEQGVEGFFKGLGKGAVGLVTRPTAGVIDFASGSLDAVKRATELGDDVVRLRAPRCMRGDGHVRPYAKLEADGNKLLREIEKGKYFHTDMYVFHLSIIQNKDILLLTDKRMVYIVHNDIFGVWQVEWSYTWTELKVPATVVSKGVQVQAGEKKKVLGLFGSTENGKIILIPDPEMRKLVRDKIESLRLRA